MYEELVELTRETREEILENIRGKTLTGYCYQNSRAMSEKLHENNIEHDLCVVGIIEDYLQGGNREMYVKASKYDEYENDIPRTRDEVLDEFKHYLILAYYEEDEIVVEPCPEVRNTELEGIIKAHDEGIYQFMYVGEWPHTQYLRLENSILDKEDRFDHF